jgi:hypothetical protein
MKKKFIEWFNDRYFFKQDRFILDQEYKILLTKFEKIKHEQNLKEESSDIVAKISNLFEQEQNRTNLSQIELYLVSIYSDEEVLMEIKIKMLETEEKLTPEAMLLFQVESQKETNINEKRILLNRLNEKLQIWDDLSDLEKNFIAKTRVRTSLFFFFAILMFFAVDQVPSFAEFLSVTKGSKGEAIVTAMSAGLMGTTFSMLLGLKVKLNISSLEDLKVIHRFDYLFSRTIIGLTSGLLLFYFFHSEMITGTIFPVFNKSTPIVTDSNNSLLILWCFISGFSEKLVPDLIAQTEKKIAS